MAFIDRILMRDQAAIARLDEIRGFKRGFPSRGLLDETGLARYYDGKFGAYSHDSDRWKEGEASLLRANPQLRRIDVVADGIFSDGVWKVVRTGSIFSPPPEAAALGQVAGVRLRTDDHFLYGLLTLDLGTEIMFTKLRVGEMLSMRTYMVRPSALDRGIVIEPQDDEQQGPVPRSMADRSRNALGIYETVREAIEALRKILRLDVREAPDGSTGPGAAG